jgi:hypothetical protein
MEDLKKVADDVERVVGSAQAVIKERPTLYGDFFKKNELKKNCIPSLQRCRTYYCG